MPVISTCPRCQRPVTIPSGVDSTALVRCPLCDAEYPLTEAFPPELIPVAGSAAKVAGAAPAEGQGLEDIFALAHESDDDLVLEAGAKESVRTEEHEPENEAVAVAGRRPMASAGLQRRAPKSGFLHFLTKFVGLIMSGLIGCLVGYYAAAWYLGPQFKAQGFPVFSFLPGVEKLTATPDKPDDAVKKPAADHPAKPKPADAKATPKLSDGPKEPPKASPESTPPNKDLVAQPPPAVQDKPEQPRAAVPQTAAVPQKAAVPDLDVEKPPPEVATPKPEPKPLRPQPGSADYLGPRMPPTVTSDQLDQATKEADVILSGDKAVKPMPPKNYEALCRLGQAVALVNGDTADAQLTDRMAAAAALLEKMAQQPERLEEFGRLAGQRIEEKSAQNGGILLAGTVKNVAQQGRLWGAVVQLADQSKSVSVLSDREIEAKVDDRVLILGIVVREPGANLVGYTGTKPAVVWAAAVAKTP